MATLKIKQYQSEKSVGYELAFESSSFSEVYSVSRDVIKQLPKVAMAFGVQARDKDLERELWDHQSH